MPKGCRCKCSLTEAREATCSPGPTLQVRFSSGLLGVSKTSAHPRSSKRCRRIPCPHPRVVLSVGKRARERLALEFVAWGGTTASQGAQGHHVCARA